MYLLLQWAWSAAETLGSDKLLFYYLTFFFFRRREQKHWNSGERQKEIQRAEKQVSSQSNILTYDLGGAECWTWRSLCNHCRLHWYSYSVTNCKSSGKGKQAASILFIHGNYTNNVLSHRLFGPTWAKVSNMLDFFYGGRKPTIGRTPHRKMLAMMETQTQALLAVDNKYCCLSCHHGCGGPGFFLSCHINAEH